MLHDLLTWQRRATAALTAASLALTPWPSPAQTDGAEEARTLAPTLISDPESLFQLEDGTITLQGGGEIPLEALFPSEGDAAALRDAYGDEAGTVDLGHAAQQELLGQDSGDGEAYRTLLGSPYDGPRDLSSEPWFDNTRTILGDIERLGAAYGSCVPIQAIGTSPRTVHLPDLRICTRPADAATTGACRIEHRLDLSEDQIGARVASYGTAVNTFKVDFAHGSWTTIAPSDGRQFVGEVPALDLDAYCGGASPATFRLAGAVGWPEAPLPGRADDSMSVTVLQQPSCGNGMTGIVQLADDFAQSLEKHAADLILTTYQALDAWWPEACVELAKGLTLPATCTITGTTIAPPGPDGCAVIDGQRICPGEPMWQAIPPPPFDPDESEISRLAGGADIQWSCPAGVSPTPIADSCGPLRDRAECKPQSSACIVGALDAGGNCTAVEDTYDCGKDVVIDDGAVRTELQCDGEIACIGDSCTGGENESNPNFAEAAATLKGAELAALDGACNPKTGECAIFTGQPASCKRVLAGTVDCCQDVQGVSLASYLQLAFTVAALGGAMVTLDPTSPLRSAWEVISNPVGASWDWIGGQFTSALNGITGSTTPAASSSEALGILGSAQQQLMQETARWTLDTFGPAAANALFTVNGGSAVAADGTLAAGTVQLGGVAAAVGTALLWVGVAYTAYQVAIILAQIIWACEEEELELAVKRELKQCTSLGSYCATDSMLGCIESRRSYCCYASPFSRIMQEQIRPQLGQGFGDAEDPDCSGISLQALQDVDWARVDLDEWIAMLADNGQLPDAESITAERLTGSLRAINSAAPAGGATERPDVIERTMTRTGQVDVPGALSSARDELMPYLQPGAGAPKPQPETVALAAIPPELLLPWRLPNRWQEQPPPQPIDPGPIDPGPGPPLPPPGPCGGRSGLPWPSGASPGTSNGRIALANAAGFGEWRGRPVDVATIFIGKNSWTVSYDAFLGNEALSPTGAVRLLSQQGICPILTVPLVTKADFMRFGMVAAGGIDREHQRIADRIREAIGTGTIYLRIGHEADEGYPWSYTNAGQPPADPGEYRAAWRRIAAIYQRAVPGARIVWNVLKNTRLKVTDYYPGDDVVDVISIDVYDNGSGGYCDSADSPGWKNLCYGSFDAAGGVSKGVNGILQFARGHGKRIALDEWGATNDALLASSGANNAFFVSGMYEFFATHSQYIEYESYYNRAGGGRHQIWPRTSYNPLPSDAYLARWRP